jgi:outer membrane protein assembly factor BamB
MNHDDFAERLRVAEGPVAPDPRFVDRLYVELAGELGLPSSRVRSLPRAHTRHRRSLALLAAAVLLAALAVALAIVGSRLLQGPVVVTGSGDWSTFRGDAARRGEGRDGPVGAPVLRWRFQANGTVPEQVVVFGELAYAASDDGVLHALDVQTGEERWSYVASEPPLKGPAVDDGMVYTFDGLGVLHALDATSGGERWQATQALASPTSTAIGDGMVFAGTGDGALVAFDAEDGTERWRVAISSTGTAYAPAFDEGVVFIAADGRGYVATDALDGTPMWSFDIGEYSGGTAVVADGMVYAFGSEPAGTGMLWALDRATGAERWRIEQPIFTPAVSSGVAYAGSVGLGVTAIDTLTGEPLWTFPTEGPARPLAVADGVVYVPADVERRVYALDAANGTELWRFDVDAQIWCCVAVAKGAVYVGTQLGGVYAIEGRVDPLTPTDR